MPDHGEDVGPSAVEQFHAEEVAGWERRNCDQAGPVRRGAGSMPLAFRISHTVDAATLTQAGQLAMDPAGIPIRGSAWLAGGPRP
jgi:hypothetical protein